MFEPNGVAVWARKAVCEVPEVGAFDQYIPEAGAGATSGAVFGSGRGGNNVCEPREALGALVIGLGVCIVAVMELVEGLLVIADVERNTSGRRCSSFPVADVADNRVIDSSDFSADFELSTPSAGTNCVDSFGKGIGADDGDILGKDCDCDF